jgi:hypothetical protein
MNDRRGKPPFTRTLLPIQSAEPGITAAAPKRHQDMDINETFIPQIPPAARSPAKQNGRKNHALLQKDAQYIIRHDEIYSVVSENYAYKTNSYYTILKMEMEGKPVRPSTSTAIDAFVVPICLERAKRAGILVCEWGISQAYVPLPAIIYGLNYFATCADFFAVNDSGKAKEAVRHITNNGKYPFCYQKLDENAEICTFTSIFGKTTGSGDAVSDTAKRIYDLFSIPLVRMAFMKTGGHYQLSSLSPVRYSHLLEGERALLEAYISRQEFL